MNKFKNILFSFKIIWLASKKQFIYKLLILIIEILSTLFSLILWRELIEVLYDAYISEMNSIIIDKIILIISSYCLVYVIKTFVGYLDNYVSFKYEDNINFFLDTTMVKKIANIDMAFYDSSNLADVVSHSWELLCSIQNILGTLFSTLKIVLQILFTLVLLSELNILVIPFILVFSIPYLFFDKLIKKNDYEFERKNINTKRKMDYYKEVYFEGNIQEIRLYNLNEYFKNLYLDEYNKYEKNIFKKNKVNTTIKIIANILIFISNSLIYYYIIKQFIGGLIELDDLTYFISIIIQFRVYVNSFFSIINDLSINLDGINDVKEFITLNPIIEKSGSRGITDIKSIEFKNVSFKYPNSETNVLKNCSFFINTKSVIGIVGINGAGKSTIIKLLLRFYDIQEGQILINGFPIDEFKIDELRKLFAVLFQDFIKYSFTLRENIALSNLKEIDNDYKIIEICNKSNVIEMINFWEKGIDENLTKRFDANGKELSGGQWQRVAIARTLFRDGKMILLDEPSSALDPIAEEEIFDKFKKISSNKMTILISHRLSSISIADRILVLDNGYICEDGTHDELMNKKGKYYEFFVLQASKYKKNGD